ncbi:LysR substrate-binding domain-containing protein [Roseibium sp.]|uniref:LysR substrate-binding domain-containing protein n=1 Tax=Roseibium sp. TaxID=1936156 RepID=UPI003A980944
MVDFRSLTLKQLRALTTTVEQGTVTAAAKSLHLTPPAVTTQLKLLEKNIGAAIFERGSEGFVPTEIGQEILAAAEMIENRLRLARERVEALVSGATGTVVVGVVSTGKYFAPFIIAGFQKAFPNIRVKLSIGNREEVIAALERDEFDLAIMGRPPATVEVERAMLGDHPHVLIAPPDHRLAGDPHILAEDLLKERFLAREPGSGTRLLMERFLDRISHGRNFEVVEMGTNETIKQAVMAGLGLAIISAHTCHSELTEGKLAALQFAGLPLVRQWYLIRRSDHPPNKATEIFQSFLLENRENYIPRV